MYKRQVIQIGAVKVVDGVVDESQTFEELVNPKYSKVSVSDNITKITGITDEEAKNARQVWEVIPEFVKFIGDDTLAGFKMCIRDRQHRNNCNHPIFFPNQSVFV